MHGTLSDGLEVNVPAQEAWQIYGTLQITHVTHTFDKIEVLQGDGGVGTTLKLTLPAGTTVFSSYEEMYTKVDDEKMIKEAEVISGGYFDLGFTLYRTRFEIIETSKTSCIPKTTIEVDVGDWFFRDLVSDSGVNRHDDVKVSNVRKKRRTTISDDYIVYLDEVDYNLGIGNDPTSFKEAIMRDHSNQWLEAMKDELEPMKINEVWDLDDLPEGVKAVGYKWVYKTKLDPKCNAERYNARIVAKGYRRAVKINTKGDTFASHLDIAYVLTIPKSIVDEAGDKSRLP
ncbi:hypothetical protein RJ639_037967 [Escallonia herrerae]|uniref:Reverse transcriptase Ty1/copia-type domain-containing protein n=1 Tax=Escallonia herrerae TaxID=1293975 RepID=A0AA88WQ84_9ASTE|nr:hypothetical protein RJ639_037967 [Escallonia herrerae]